MADSGGSATVYGVLYQVLRSLKWIRQLQLQGTKETGELVSARLVLEPLDGGDLQLIEPRKRVVEQCKSRRSNRPWSLREICKEVFPDLLRAVDATRLDTPTEFRFVTEGRCSDWANARELFRTMHTMGCPADPFESLPDGRGSTKKYFSAKAQGMTPRAFFREVVDIVAKEGGCPDFAGNACFARQVWHVAANFDVVPEQTAEELLVRLDDLIAKRIDNPDDCERVRNDLVGRVLSLSTVAGTSLSPTEFCRQTGLDRVSLGEWQAVLKKLNAGSVDDRKSLFRYDAALDVRPPELPGSETSVLFVTGDSERTCPGGSGCGKSFYLGAIAHLLVTRNELTVATRALGSAQKTLGRVADIIWVRGFRRHTSLPLEAVANTIKRECIGIPTPWLTVLVDDLRSPEELRELLEFPWTDCGIRLVAAVPSDFSRLLTPESPRNRIHNLNHFTAEELREYLRRREISWGSLPSDMRLLLQWPLLAQLFCDVASDGQFHPENEYHLFKKTWDRLINDPRQVGHQDDQPKLRELVLSSINGEAAYPWDMKSCTAHGIDSNTVERLIHAGWATRDNGRVRIRHHRLLSWAIAEAVADDFRERGIIASEAAKILLKEPAETVNYFESAELGYVAMDLLWLAADHSARRSRDAHTLVNLMVRENSWSWNDDLFEHMIPTLGFRAARVVADYLQAKNLTDHAFDILWVTKSLKKIGQAAPHEVAQVAAEMLSDPVLGTGDCAVQVLKKYPTAAANNGLWEWIDRLRNLEATALDESGIQLREVDVIEALANCVAMAPEWIATKLLEACHRPSDLNILAIILAQSESKAADGVWKECRARLLESLPAGCRGFAECIARFRDRDLVPELERWLNGRDKDVQTATRNALSTVAPETLLSNLERGYWPAHYASSGFWLPSLIINCHDETVAVFERLFRSSPEHVLLYAQAIKSWIDVFPESIVDSLVAAVDRVAVNCENGPGGELNAKLMAGMSLIVNISNPSLLQVLTSYRGSEFDERLTRLGQKFVDETFFPHLALRPLLSVLRHIGSRGLTSVVNYLLKSCYGERKLLGLEWAAYEPDADTFAGLRAIACSSDEELSPTGHPSPIILRQRAVKLLAELGDDIGLIQALLVHEQGVLELARLRSHLPPMEELAAKLALEEIESGDTPSVRLGLKALGVTGRRDLIPLLLKYEAGPLDGELSFAALCGLCGLKADDVASLSAFNRHLPVKEHRHIAFNGLLLSGRGEARRMLLEHLEFSFDTDPMSPDLQVAVILSQDLELRDRAMELIGKHANLRDAFGSIFQPSEPMELLGEVQDADIRDALYDAADPVETNFNVEGRRASAVRGLAKQAPLEAAQAAVRALQSGKYDRDHFPDILIDIEGSAAIPKLLGYMISEPNHLVRRSIGLALRKYSGRAEVVKSLAEQLGSQVARERKSAAEVIAWLGPKTLKLELESAFRAEALAHVRWEMGHAIWRHQNQTTMSDLLDAMKGTTGLQTWDFADTALNLDDAKLLGLVHDPLWIGGEIWDDLPVPLQRHINDRYRERIKKTKDELKRMND